jgi:hypothetical protein
VDQLTRAPRELADVIDLHDRHGARALAEFAACTATCGNGGRTRP